MSKQIRPLSLLKRVNPDLYNHLISGGFLGKTGLSKKGTENEAYWLFCIMFGEKRDDYNLDDTDSLGRDSFYFRSPDVKNNIATVTELGRLLMIGYCYNNVEEFTKRIAGYVYRAYHKKLEAKQPFNDTDYSELVKYIRENIGYYHTREPEAKLLLLERLFKEELQPLLPPPTEELIKHNRVLEIATKLRKEQRKAGVDKWIDRTEEVEAYAYYLQELLDKIGYTDYLSLKDWIAKDREALKVENEAYWSRIKLLQDKYRASIVNKVNLINLI